jgi:bifunctional non-homologous end joining protein LigD
MNRNTIKLKGINLTLTNLEKTFYPETGTKKSQIIDYYLRIAHVILPHLKNRPLSLKTYPNGVLSKTPSFENRCPAERPQWIKTTSIPQKNGEIIESCLANNIQSLIWITNQSSLETYIPVSRIEDINSPNYMIFDLHPGTNTNIINCAQISLFLRDLLQKIGLKSFLKSSGGKGLHLYVPLNTRTSFSEVRLFAGSVARILERNHPHKVTSQLDNSVPPGKVFIDWSRNERLKTTVCVYSLRANQRPTVSMPIDWNELKFYLKLNKPELFIYELKRAVKQVESFGDIFREVLELKQKLPHENPFTYI